MSNKIKKINRQLEKLETQRKELLQKRQAEEEAVLLEIGRTVGKCIAIEEVDLDRLRLVLKEHYHQQKDMEGTVMEKEVVQTDEENEEENNPEL